MMTQNDISPFLQARVDRLLNNADHLFALGNIREQCQQELIAFYTAQQPSPYAKWGQQLFNDVVLCFAQTLTLTYLSAKNEIVKWAKGCTEEFLLQEVKEEREEHIKVFARMKIAHRWYQMKDDDSWWCKFANNIPFNDADREGEIKSFFDILNKICIFTDILLGHAEEYGIDVDYSNCISSQEKETVVKNTLTPNRQDTYNQLLTLVDKGDWKYDEIAYSVKQMLRTILGQDETPLSGNEAEQSETLWRLLENGRGDRVKIVWQNMVGYLDDKKLFRLKGSPALNKDFFGDDKGYTNIDKGRPSKDLMTPDFESIIPLLDAYVPKLDKKA